MDTPFTSMNGQTGFYSIRVLVNHPSWSVADITSRLGEMPDYSWNATDHGKKEAMWARESYTTGKRLFFDEVHEVLTWIHGKGQFAEELKKSGGCLSVIVQLSGAVNIGDELEPKTMQLAVTLGVKVGVEVFPNMRHPEPMKP
jgi:hypothetical protein